MHARLSPSAAHRWMSCPASLRASDQVHDGASESVYALEGTTAHELGEIRACERFGLCTPAYTVKRVKEWSAAATENGFDAEVQEDMERYMAEYCDFIAKVMDEHVEPNLFLEQRYETGVPEVWGTTDAAIVSARRLDVVDLKYGMGVRINSDDNPQLMFYGLGALEQFDLVGSIEVVVFWIFQPRLGHVSRFEMSAEDLRTWRDMTAIPAARLALSDDAPFHPSESACRFCPASGSCRAQVEQVLLDFREPDLLTPLELGQQLDRVAEVRAWCDAIEAKALDSAYTQGVPIPGWKVVRSNGRRSIPDSEAAIKKLQAAGYKVGEVAERKIKTLGALEKLMRSREQELNEVLGELITKSEGRPALARETDSRPEIDPVSDAQADFGPHHDT